MNRGGDLVDAERRCEDILHYVDLAGCRPADRADVGAEHPEAGHKPVAEGILMLASMRPYWKFAVEIPWVFKRAEVQVPALLRASITK